ncbi:MAG: AzlC family ABC transporter permease [Negativicutes bacterium]
MNGREFRAGVRDTLPLMLGVFPFGLAYGIFGQSVGLTSGETLLMSLTVFAGAAQFISLPMFAAGSGLVMISLTTLLINLRHLLMGASLVSYMEKLSWPWKAFLCFGMADETYAVTISRAQTFGYHRDYHFGSNATGYVTWAVSTILGVVLGSHISNPLAWGLDFAMPATFLALLVPRLLDRVSLVVSAVATVVSVAAAVLIPGKWYIILACLAAVAVGAWMEGGEPDEV